MVALPRLPSVKIARHDAIIVLSVSGDIAFTLETAEFSSSMQAAAVAPTTPHVLNTARARSVSIYVHLIHPLYPSLRERFAQPIQALDRAAFAHLDEALLQAGQGTLSVDRAARLIDDVLAIVLAGRPVRPLDPRIQRIMRKLDTDLTYPFKQFAADLGLSASRLSHLFSKELGLPFRSYLAWCRVVLAWEMVALKPEMSFTQIAHAWGFSDSSHMARSFHANLGMTPTMMRDRSAIRIIGKPMPPGQHVPGPA